MSDATPLIAVEGRVELGPTRLEGTRALPEATHLFEEPGTLDRVMTRPCRRFTDALVGRKSR